MAYGGGRTGGREQAIPLQSGVTACFHKRSLLLLIFTIFKRIVYLAVVI